jgi:hypothetical protein
MTHSPSAGRPHRTRAWLLAVPVLASIAPAAYAAPTFLPGVFNGSATAAAADVSTGVLSLQLTHLAQGNCPCAGTNGHAVLDRVGPVNIPGLVNTSLTIARSIGTRTATTANANEISHLEGLSLFGGLIQASAMQAEANINATATTLTTSPAGTFFVKLKINGTAMPSSPPANTVVPVPGIGTVTLNQVTQTGDGKTSSGLSVTLLALNVSVANNFGLPVGATVTIGQAVVGYSRNQAHEVVAGNAYAIDTNAVAVSALPGIGPLAAVISHSCSGTPGKATNSTAAVSLGPITAGAGNTSLVSEVTSPTTSISQATATLTGISLLGLISADNIVSEATETTNKTAITASTAGTQFGSLSVGGVPLPLNVPPNTNIPLPLLGYVLVNEQIAPVAGHAGPLTVNGLHIYITTPNVMNLPVGTEIIVAHAVASTQSLPE